MINRVIVSGVLITENVEVVNNDGFTYCEFLVATQDIEKDKIRNVKLRAYGRLAYDFVKMQNKYKTHLCMYFGELYFITREDKTIVKINETPQVLASIGD